MEGKGNPTARTSFWASTTGVLTAIAALLTAVGGLVGAWAALRGDGSPTTTLTPTDWRAAADEVCAQAHESYVAPPFGSDSDALAFAQKSVGGIVRDARAELLRIKVGAADKAAFVELTDQLARYADSSDRLAMAYFHNSMEEINAGIAQSTTIGRQIEASAAPLGLPSCVELAGL